MINNPVINNSSISVLYEPLPDFTGVETFLYEVSDGILSDTAKVTVTVLNIDNDRPIAKDDLFMVQEDSVANLFDVLKDNGQGP